MWQMDHELCVKGVVCLFLFFKPEDFSSIWHALLGIWKLVISLGPSIVIRENNYSTSILFSFWCFQMNFKIQG